MNETPQEPLVGPWVLDPTSGGDEPVRIEDAIERRLASDGAVEVHLVGPSGSGRRCALAYLRRVYACRPEIGFLGPGEPSPAETRVRVDLAAPARSRKGDETCLELAPWSRDEWIEFLMARHPDACASVLERMEQSGDGARLGATPRLAAAILEELAADPELTSPEEALHRAVSRRFSRREERDRIAEWCLTERMQPGRPLEPEVPLEVLERVAQEAGPFLRHDPVAVLLAAERLVAGLAGRLPPASVTLRIEPRVFHAARPFLARAPETRASLKRWLGEASSKEAPALASLLHLHDPRAVGEALRELREGRRPLPFLAEAELEGLEGQGLDLSRVDLAEARLAGARLEHANLRKAGLSRVRLERADLRAANLAGAELFGADLTNADLRGAVLDGAVMDEARLEHARLEGTSLRQARLEKASLRGALLDGADLSGVRLRDADLTDASLLDTNLAGAYLDDLDLRGTRLATRALRAASLIGCHLEGWMQERPDLSNADLEHGLLTGSVLPGADLRRACLASAGLAHVSWPGADLRGADLSRASFHLGSSRSGLVSTSGAALPAGWGSRTGFYGDELRDWAFRRAEEIRVADLRGADLRGARIADTDFYLVDLREALLDPDQERHVRACGAIR